MTQCLATVTSGSPNGVSGLDTENREEFKEIDESGSAIKRVGSVRELRLTRVPTSQNRGVMI